MQIYTPTVALIEVSIATDPEDTILIDTVINLTDYHTKDLAPLQETQIAPSFFFNVMSSILDL